MPMPLKTLTDPRLALLEPLLDKNAAVLGFGNQGAAHAVNLRDSGVDVVVANRSESPGFQRAIASGFTPTTIPHATESADLLIVALPDEAQPDLWRTEIAPNLRPGSTVGFLHGFNVHYGFIDPPRDIGVVMVAPKGPGTTLRQRFEQGHGIPCLFAVHRESPDRDAEALGLAWAAGIGCARAAIVYTSFAHETETDLFGEQTVLCGGMTQLILAAFETLVDSGYPPELAYMECCQEAKQITDLIYERGLAGTMDAISNTAEFGAHKTGPGLIDDAVRARMRIVLDDIRNGAFAAGLRADHAAGFPWFNARRQALRNHPIEAAGSTVRTWLPWLSDPPAPHPDRT